MEEQCSNLIKDFKKRIDYWRNSYSGLEFIYNEQLDNLNFSHIQYILVGDNPGEKELNQKVYFAEEKGFTTAGSNARRLFKYLGLNFNEEVLVLNKTPIFTKSTSDLKDLKKTDGIFYESQIDMAKLAYALHKCIGCKMYITGLAGCYKKDRGWVLDSSTAILPNFFLEIKDLYSKKDCVLKERMHIIKHFSYWKVFSDGDLKMKDIEKYNVPRDRVISELESTKYLSELFQE